MAAATGVTESVDVSALLPASSLEVSLFIDEGDGTGNTSSPGEMFLIQDLSVDLAGAPAPAPTATGPDGFVYDAAGRMVSRTVDGVATALSWDVTSSLVESNGQGGHVVYAYDAGGQRVVQVRVADADGPGSATAYVASGQVHDADTATVGHVSATRFYTFAGSTVAVRTDDGQLALMLGDEQGSTSVMMPVTVTASGTLASATLADAAAVTRTAYTPYGELRGGDNLAVDRGWLGQVEDRISTDGASGTGLTYLNARYYDPALGRFLSPDSLMDPGDPRTLDPYRYADNNPVVFVDVTGLSPCGSWLDRVWMGMLGSSCGSSPDGATYTGAVATGVASGGEQWKNDQLRVFTPAGGQQLASDVMQYGAQAPAVWTTQSVLNSGQQLASATESFVGAQRYDSPAMASNAAESATPLVLDGTRNYVSTMYGAAGVSFSALGPTTTSVFAPKPTSPSAASKNAPQPNRSPGTDLVPYKPWPSNDGFFGRPRVTVLRPGTVIDRYGSGMGTFASPAGTPFNSRGLPSTRALDPRMTFVVQRRTVVRAGVAAPWQGSAGGGVQYKLPASVNSLVRSGHLRIYR